jgi:uncharacterized membrane protein YphA (DoxX/SURF4 family)
MKEHHDHAGDWRVASALLLLRLGLGYFLLVWGVNKFLAPKQTVAIWGYFYGIDISAWLPQLFGAGESIVAVAIIAGLARRLSYGTGLLIHGVTIVVISERLVAPFVIEDGFPVNRNLSVAVPALMAFAAMYLMRARDAWSLDNWIARHRAKTRPGQYPDSST